MKLRTSVRASKWFNEETGIDFSLSSVKKFVKVIIMKRVDSLYGSIITNTYLYMPQDRKTYQYHYQYMAVQGMNYCPSMRGIVFPCEHVLTGQNYVIS
jgi:hypothetical protein